MRCLSTRYRPIQKRQRMRSTGNTCARRLDTPKHNLDCRAPHIEDRGHAGCGPHVRLNYWLVVRATQHRAANPSEPDNLEYAEYGTKLSERWRNRENAGDAYDEAEIS